MDSVDHDDLVQLTADIVSAYVTKHKIGADALAKLIEDVHRALRSVPATQAATEPEIREPAVSVRRSITPDYLVCLEIGRASCRERV